MSVQSVIAAAVGPILTALLAALGFWLRDRRQSRNRQQAYQRALEESSDQVAFIRTWLDAHQQIASPQAHEQARAQALSDLERAYVRVEQARDAVGRRSEPFSVRRGLKRLLLLDSMHTTSAKIWGVVYYLSLAWLLVFGTFGLMIGLLSPFTGSSGSLLGEVLAGLGLSVFALAIGVAPTLPLHWLVVAADGRPNDSQLD